MAANDRQVGGNHYRKHGATGEQHWDRIIRLYPETWYVYFAAVVTKYVERCNDKNGLEDLKKARHYLDKWIETLELKPEEKTCKPKSTTTKRSGRKRTKSTS